MKQKVKDEGEIVVRLRFKKKQPGNKIKEYWGEKPWCKLDVGAEVEKEDKNRSEVSAFAW